MKAYLSARSVGLGNIGTETRREIWSRLPRDQALVLLAQMLADVDLSVLPGPIQYEADEAWASRVTTPSLRTRIQLGLRPVSGRQSVLLAPQLLLSAVGEAIRFCPDGIQEDSFKGTDGILACLLGIADDLEVGDDALASSPPTAELWGGLDPRLATDLIANQHFNRYSPLHHLMAAAERRWSEHWPSITPAADVSGVGGQPDQLFLEATGVDPSTLHHVAVHLFVQCMRHRYLRFPEEFFSRIGLDVDSTHNVLNLISTDAASLGRALDGESALSRWSFDPMRRWPLLRLDDGCYLILRLGWLIERGLSDITYFDIRESLRRFDVEHTSSRVKHFDRCIQARLEYDVGEALRRTFDRRGGQVWDEKALNTTLAASFSSAHKPKMCDYVVRVGHIWLVVDATRRALRRDVVLGVAGTGGIEEELNRVLFDRKIEQLESTIDLLRTQMHLLTGEGVDVEAIFVPIVVTADQGLGWGPFIALEVEKRTSRDGLLQGEDLAPVALMSLKDISLLEHEGESQGVRAIDALLEWRRGPNAAWAFDQHLSLSGRRLAATRLERKAAARMMTEAGKRLRTGRG